MTAFRVLLAVGWVALVGYTVGVIERHGMGLVPIYFGDIARGGWPGQFNADFLCFLVLSALWTAWRERFSPAGLALGLVALVGGAGFLLPYLFVLSVRVRGDVAALLLGPSRVAGRLDSRRDSGMIGR